MVAATRKKTAAPQEGGTTKESNTRKTCKTCSSCRLKKVRCCGTQPRCAECISDELDCVYLRDARREPRPSRAHVNRLETALSTMLKHMKSAGLSPVDMSTEEWIQTWCSGSLSPVPEKEEHQLRRVGSHQPYEITINIDAPGVSDTGGPPQQGILVPSSVSLDCRKDTSPPKEAVPITEKPAGESSSPGLEIASLGVVDENVVGPSHSDYMPSTLSSLVVNSVSDKDNVHQHTSPGSVGSGIGRTPHRQQSFIDDRDRLSELSMGEAHVAGISHQDGSVSSVHGLTSVMNSTGGIKGRGFLIPDKTQRHHARTAIKDRLMSYAALQSQRETWVYNQPHIHVDLDGCDVDLAKHLIDLHFSIQHYTYLISYRPAIIDSLASGGGPWCNKLLLNAIYYSSSLFSNRPCFREDPKGPKNIGSQFCNRFYQLLGPEIVRPSIPSAVGLLLMSASLVSHGRASAGWNLSGIAYRMVIDLGCHLTLGPDHQGSQSMNPMRSSEGALNQDLEQEMRKRLYWGAFATDATQSLYLGRPCMLATIEARVPFEFLDTFEELEKWEPYMDHDPQTVHLNPPSYAPQPAHAVSTFGAVARLLQISTRIGKLYGIGAIKCSSTDIQCDLVEIEKELQEWSGSLPSHLHFDAETCRTQAPPPHKINPHTTFHALNILLHRAFLQDGHLHHHSDSNITTRSEEACLHSALMIEKYLRALRDTFTLRGGPFLLCYATYSAVSIVLRAERHSRGRYLENISFFWTCLSEMQRGCNFGMMKPLAILKDMVREYNISIQQSGISMDTGNNDSDVILAHEGLDESFFELTHSPLMTLDDGSAMSITAANYVSDLHDFQAAQSGNDWLGDGSASDFTAYLDEQEQQLWRDTLYGLFTSSLPFA